MTRHIIKFQLKWPQKQKIVYLKSFSYNGLHMLVLQQA